ncbi:avidin/streptavidin family protein [Bradyrhizobium glycinis]|uniref:avidin/streptavidin family protein n=1 Tax=Bradyrhizobium glycinis TaxID=2751812 RepID=UPI0018D67C8A|nr:avidin/streptavidin family protein [Bradyrhizobium glycinis]MBH5373487.1 hypothetical protein [Bradyrhizobium glycinis]
MLSAIIETLRPINSVRCARSLRYGTHHHLAISNSCDEGASPAMTSWLARANSGTAISFTVTLGGCGSVTVWTLQVNAGSGFQGIWFLSLAEPVVRTGISAGDKSKLMTAGKGEAKNAPGKKLSNTKNHK